MFQLTSLSKDEETESQSLFAKRIHENENATGRLPYLRSSRDESCKLLTRCTGESAGHLRAIPNTRQNPGL
jgi:hypothetical protein